MMTKKPLIVSKLSLDNSIDPENFGSEAEASSGDGDTYDVDDHNDDDDDVDDFDDDDEDETKADDSDDPDGLGPPDFIIRANPPKDELEEEELLNDQEGETPEEDETEADADADAETQKEERGTLTRGAVVVF